MASHARPHAAAPAPVADAAPAKAFSRKDLTGPALRTFFRIAEAWGLKEAEQMRLLGLDSRSTLQSWKRGAVSALSKDALERISYVMGIYKGLHVLLPQTADDWVRKPNSAAPFGGRSALERMLSGQVADLYVVRQYVDAQRG
ncbi:MbcA/ParS/Xre antitoxin family protein [Novosphingobium sp. 9]|uniref:MbcA/ParS/Xre antitoxin family protein n=1 Tax=Novosphingobium sp. 9 TaxID=2025349 RepID=UPI0021B62D6D|nr:MbcA/ParS/Xre antitoxin family protein [Novosphingobium sp. 9]